MTIQHTLRPLHHRHELGAFLNAAGLTGKGVEVGTLFGTYANEILRTWRGHLYCVDPWVNQPRETYHDGANELDMNSVYAQAQAGVGRNPRCTLLRMMSLNGAGKFEDGELDFFYDDGNHAVDSVRADLAAWFPKVRIGGIFSGHDFFTRYDKDTNSDALTAVMEFAEAVGVRPHVTWDSSWWFVKTAEMDAAFRRACIEGRLPRPVYTDNFGLNCVVVLPVARFDFNLALKWLKWVAKLDEGSRSFKLVVWTTPELTLLQLQELGDAAESLDAKIEVNHTLNDNGYFGAPNQVFKGALDYCERAHRCAAILWAEADTVPTRASWVADIMDEYRACGRPFMGDVQREGGIPHLTGNAVYHPNWRTLAPALAALPGPVPEMGWDSQAAHDVLPRAHYAKTIQQVWRPPLPITKTWALAHIRPETALFHQCKDGSLIDVLCEERGLAPIPLTPALCESTYEADKKKFADIAMTGAVLARAVVKPERKGGVEILCVTFRRDIEFFEYALRSYEKFATGFTGFTLAVPVQDARFFQKFAGRVKLTTFDETKGKGMLHHEIMICRADELCPDADHVLHLDADVMFWEPVKAEDYVANGRCLMVRERYEDIAPRNPNRLIWRRCVEAATGIVPEFENMVRHPNVFPRALYGHMRGIVEAHTGRAFDEFVLSCENGFPQGFCEFNTLGAVGIRDMPDKFNFIDYDHGRDGAECGVAANIAYQYLYRPTREKCVEFWSHSGLARYKADMDKFLRGERPKYYLK